MSIPSYNKGEWSEAYVLVKVLADGELAQGNGDLQATDDQAYKVVSVFRNDADLIRKKYTRIDSNVVISCGLATDLTVNLDQFKKSSLALLKEIQTGQGRSFSVSQELWTLLNELSITQIKAPSTGKTDIEIEINDHFSNIQSVLGFSVKSRLGNASTLVNASKATNFRYKVDCTEKQFTAVSSLTKGKDQIKFLKANNIRIIFSEVLNTTFSNNLRLIDGDLSEVLAECLVEYFSGAKSKLVDILSAIDLRNPCDFPLDQETSFYVYKLKRYLCESALGMMPNTSWSGRHDATGGYIVVKECGELLSYHLLRKNLFEDYLFQNTKFETASTSRNNFGQVSSNDEGYYVDLNLQIRFLK